MTLEEAITQAINLGEKDPLEIARKIEREQGREWMGEQLVLYAEDLVAEIARQRLGVNRRLNQLALRPGDVKSQAELKLDSFWVPEFGWKRAADLTSADLRARAAWYDRAIDSLRVHGDWCREVAGMMDADRVKTLGKLKRPLPALPERELVA